MIRPFIILGVLLSVPQIARAQDASNGIPGDSVPYAPFAKPSYGWVAWPDSMMYEGDVRVPVHLWSRTRSLQDVDASSTNNLLAACIPLEFLANVARVSPARARAGCTVTFVPHFVIRQLSGGSAEVVSQSFNPAFEVNLYLMDLDQDSVSGTDRRGTLLVANYRLGHYSNGQGGCLYRNQVENSDGSCSFPTGQEPSIGMIDVNGSFSTHYVEVGASGARFALNSEGAEKWLASLEYAFRVYPGGWVASIGGMQDDLAATYGRTGLALSSLVRIQSKLPYTNIRNTRSLSAEIDCRLLKVVSDWRCRQGVSAFTTFPGLYGFGFAVRYTGGWDYYNLRYGRNIGASTRRWSLGVVLDHATRIRFRGLRSGKSAVNAGAPDLPSSTAGPGSMHERTP